MREPAAGGYVLPHHGYAETFEAHTVRMMAREEAEQYVGGPQILDFMEKPIRLG